MLPLAEALREAARHGVPLLHFGQTVFWDEPTKALLFPAMREAGVEIPVIAGVHDTDYFSKLPAHVRVSGPFAVLPANDGSTRDLWVGPCECSALFGAEHRVPLRLFAGAGVPVRRLARTDPKGAEAFANEHTEAWGWRGVARIGPEAVTARDVTTGPAAKAIRELLTWAVQQSLLLLTDEATRNQAERNASQFLCRLHRSLEAHADQSLTECFRDLLRQQIERLAGAPQPGLTVTSSTAFYRFCRETAPLVRFRPLTLFLAPETREAACEAYDAAVRGSGAYTLESFGEGALPFELVVPGRGRGTLHCSTSDISVELPAGRVTLGGARGVVSAEDLAALVERRLGRECSLIAKAVVLPLMFLGESIMVLAEGGSQYVASCTRHLVRDLAARGIRLRLYPVMRLRYHALDALGAIPATLALPEHLAGAFGNGQLTTEEFAGRWREAVAEQAAMLERLRASGGVAAALDPQGNHVPHRPCRLERYRCLQKRMREQGESLSRMSEELRAIGARARERRERAAALEAKSGAIRRGRLKPLWTRLESLPPAADPSAVLAEIEEVETVRRGLQAELRAARAEAAALAGQWRELRARILAEQRTGVSVIIHTELHRLEEETVQDRLRLVRQADLTSTLAHNDRRPSAWWFLLLGAADGSLPWYDEVRRRCEAWFEDLTVPDEGA